MSKATNKTHHVLVRVGNNDDGDYSIDAAYYDHQDDFTVFKSADGSPVASFANRELIAITVQPPKMKNPQHTVGGNVTIRLGGSE